MNFVYYAIAVFGFEYIVGRSVISQVPREYLHWFSVEQRRCEICHVPVLRYDKNGEVGFFDCVTHGSNARIVPYLKGSRILAALLALIECPACLGFWVGLIYSVQFDMTEIVPVHSHFVFALLTSGVSLILGKLTRVMD